MNRPWYLRWVHLFHARADKPTFLVSGSILRNLEVHFPDQAGPRLRGFATRSFRQLGDVT